MFKFFLGTLLTAAMALLAMLPEILLYLLWTEVIQPELFIEKAVTFALFATFGSSICVLAVFVAFSVWAAGMVALGELDTHGI